MEQSNEVSGQKAEANAPEELRVSSKGKAPDYGEIRTVEEALKLEHVLSNQKGEMYILMFADWCGHCQTYKPFWNKLRDMSSRMIPLAAVQDAQKDNIKFLKEAPLDGYPTVIHVKEDGTMEAVDPTEMRDESGMKTRVSKDTKQKGIQQLLGYGGPIGKIIQAGAGLLSSVRRRLRNVRSLFPTKSRKHGKHGKHGKRPSRRNERTRKAKRAGRTL
jgi:thiol-disulfide isomerase/thioredoxin